MSPTQSGSLVVIAWVSLGVAVGCAVAVAVDQLRGHRHHMVIMDVVWPITMLWSGPLGLWAYVRFGRAGRARGEPDSPRAIAKAATHCGSGCTLGDLVAETFTAFVPLTLFGEHIFGSWALDYALALLFGIAFQYFTIKPMKDLPPGQALVRALKADVLSLSAWQVGMYGVMGLLHFAVWHRDLPKSDPVFWLAMQAAMLLGFATAFPVNAWLLRRGIKEAM